MEEQEILNLETGTKEITTLEPKPVKIVQIKIQTITFNNKESQKAVFVVKHPDREETIEISSVKYEKKGKLETSGLWVSIDEEKKIRKGSALSMLKAFYRVKTLKNMEGLEIQTTEDDKGYLCFKAY